MGLYVLIQIFPCGMKEGEREGRKQTKKERERGKYGLGTFRASIFLSDSSNAFLNDLNFPFCVSVLNNSLSRMWNSVWISKLKKGGLRLRSVLELQAKGISLESSGRCHCPVSGAE